MAQNVTPKLLEVIPAGSIVLEIGTGFGTIELAEVFKVISIENDPQWHQGVSQLIHAPLVRIDTPRSVERRWPDFHEWYDPEVLKRELEGLSYDAIIVDGPATKRRRYGFFYFRDLFDLTVPIIIDDVHRIPDFRMAISLARTIKAKEMQIFDTHLGHSKVFARILP